MCLAVPSQVVELLPGERALVEAFGMRRTVSLALMEEAPAIGDYLLVQAGGYAVETVEPARAHEALAFFAADGLESAFRRIERENMDGVAMLNPALEVEAVGFAPWQGHWLGALVSPWFVNLVIVRGSQAGWTEAGEGEAVLHRFPSGDFAFLAAHEPEVGEFQTCALTTKMHGFATHEAAREFAQAALQALQAPPEPQAGAPAERPPERMSKRRFLGALLPLRPL